MITLGDSQQPFRLAETEPTLGAPLFDALRTPAYPGAPSPDPLLLLVDRLDILIDEVRGLRTDLAAARHAPRLVRPAWMRRLGRTLARWTRQLRERLVRP